MKSNRNRFMTYTALAVCTSLLWGSVATVQAADTATYEQYLSGEMSQSKKDTASSYETISISTEEELAEFAKNCRLDTWSTDKLVTLEADIQLSAYNDIMIPSFGGVFDGNGHKISGLRLTSAGSAIGLFRYIQTGATVKNLTVSGEVKPDGTGNQVGILAGVNYGRIQNCTAEGHVTGNSEVGGLIGVNQSTGEIRRSQSSAAVIGNHLTGGICGSNYGSLNNCSNSGSVNAWSSETTYSLDEITVDSLEDINNSQNIAANTDNGGITGYSEGKIYYCTNSGTVGYQHVGYNTGGIVGRLHQGYVQNCTNTGHIYGRKDVGGITGQMEPFLEVQYLGDKLSEIDTEVDKFMDLLDAAHQDLSGYGSQITSLAKDVTAKLNEVTDAAGEISGTTADLWYLYNQELSGVASDLDRLGSDLKDAQDSNAPSQDQQKADLEESLKDLIGNGSVSSGDINGDIGNIIDKIEIPDNTESYEAALKRFGDSVSERLKHVTSATNEETEGLNDNLNKLNDGLRTAGDSLRQLTDVLEETSDHASDHVDALIAQAKVLRTTISDLRDNLFEYEGISIEDTSDEAAGGDMDQLGDAPDKEESYYDTSSFQKGKITLCLNSGTVEADTNVGGIVGQIATEYDFDPEDDVTFSGVESFNIEQSVKAVVRESRNAGEIISKKDYAGGIVGRAEFGAIISCEAYGDVSSTGGSYVGGIAGASSYAIRSCYTMGNLSGKNDVGGIAGKGSDIFYSYTYPAIEYTGEYAGAIAGQVSEDGTLYGNYYVDDALGGVDNIGYAGGAEPLTYEELCQVDGIPDAFSEFTITFMADGEELASYQCHYGDSLSESQIPKIPQKEDSYGVWPEYDFSFITGNKVLEAEYEKWVGSLASEETDANGKPLVLVQGNFLPEAELRITQTEAGTYVEVGTVTEDGSFEPISGSFGVRALCEDTENTKVEILTENNQYEPADTQVMGSYLVFTMEKAGTFRMVVEKNTTKKIVVSVIAAAVVILLVILIGKKLRKKRKARKVRRQEKKKAQETASQTEGEEKAQEAEKD